MDASEARRALADVDRLRHDTRRRLHPLWFENLVVGVFFLAATLASAVAIGPAVAAAVWIGGGAAALALIVAHAVRRERALGAESRLPDASFAVLAGIAAGVVAAHALTSGTLGEVAWTFPVAAGWLALAALYRDALMAAAAAGLAAVALALLAAAPDHAGLWAQGAMGALLITAGLAGRRA